MFKVNHTSHTHKHMYSVHAFPLYTSTWVFIVLGPKWKAISELEKNENSTLQHHVETTCIATVSWLSSSWLGMRCYSSGASLSLSGSARRGGLTVGYWPACRTKHLSGHLAGLQRWPEPLYSAGHHCRPPGQHFLATSVHINNSYISFRVNDERW